jgi:mRNA interferase MazF
MRRGDVCWYTLKAPDKRRPVLILTRTSAISLLNALTIAPITTTVRDIPSEVYLSRAEGMLTECAVNCDNLQTVPKAQIDGLITTLSSLRMQEVNQALAFALGLDS